MRGILVSMATLAAVVATTAQAQTPLRPGQTINGALQATDTRWNDIRSADCYELTGPANSIVNLELRSTSFSGYIDAAQGCALDSTQYAYDVADNDTPAQLQLRMNGTAVYIRVSSQAEQALGDYALKAVAVRDIETLFNSCTVTAPAARAQAVAACAELLSGQDLNVDQRATVYVQLSARHLEGGDGQAAKAAADEALRLKPGLVDALLMRADAHQRLGDDDAALADYASALEAGPQDGRVHLYRGIMRNRRGETALARTDMDAAIRLNPQLADAWAMRASFKSNAKDWAGAASDYAQALQLAPDNAQWTVLLGQVEAAGGDDPAALSHYERAIQMQPDLVLAWYSRGLLYNRQGRSDQALSNFNEAIRLNPAADLVLRSRAALNLKLKNYDSAIADADRGAELAPGDAEHHNERCWARAVANRDLDAARSACDRSLELRPNAAHVLDSRALVFLRQGRFDEAWTDYDAAVRLEGGNAGYRYGRGLAAIKAGRTGEGQGDIVAALGLDPEVSKVYAEMGLRP